MIDKYIGDGLHSGPVFAGNQGSRIKAQYAVIGDTVNVASRLEGLTKENGQAILLSDATCQRLSESARARLASISPARPGSRVRPTRSGSGRPTHRLNRLRRPVLRNQASHRVQIPVSDSLFQLRLSR
ncbi:MAG: hypothetical protein A2087_04335 [Spirochaetes bacterium GWD1_61_31]|nr:MAG: hypothetical protein A2Y37_10900 [Spirochaetes bacterium GWB1_60_80]OHD35437.1 MAG: hypothetical protein A2087_04335 [Spirochaetes bacterium GWD1_61_31]OHD44946.1 MAG: hypothetical protein A2Y35_12940 [Spirochaetes bacterium GWE1_60_18]OHD60056.1 MAG: hypothetical protein A2Y32_11055 [Spirochaetes bacterium GWF1_60_12]HAP43616.1 hypothetical protein [Spirochaetaceae bacterium]